MALLQIWVRNMASKKDIRKSVLQKREQLTDRQWTIQSAVICKKVLAQAVFGNSDCIYCYVDYKREVGTCAIIEAAWKMGKKVAVPIVHGDDMHFGYLSSWDELSEGYKGILEPRHFIPAEDETPLVIMPGAVFDRQRNRIGYGKGYYDKFLGTHPHCKTLAIAFELQLVDEVPAEPLDIRPQVLITEEHIYDD